jgi:hypothetical protein
MKVSACSFCGSKDVRPQQALVGQDWSVVCQECDAIGPPALSAKFAIIEWNRVPPAAWAVNMLAYQEEIKQLKTEIQKLKNDTTRRKLLD